MKYSITLTDEGKKQVINSIKALRSLLSLGLKEAKEAVNAMMYSGTPYIAHITDEYKIAEYKSDVAYYLTLTAEPPVQEPVERTALEIDLRTLIAIAVDYNKMDLTIDLLGVLGKHFVGGEKC